MANASPSEPYSRQLYLEITTTNQADILEDALPHTSSVNSITLHLSAAYQSPRPYATLVNN